LEPKDTNTAAITARTIISILLLFSLIWTSLFILEVLGFLLL